MKKTVLASALLTAMMATSAQADTLLGFKVGGDYWQADTSGTVGAVDPNYDSSAQGSVWVSLEHPIPLIPNVMIRENMLKQDGSSVDDVSLKTDLSNTDFIFYYEILDNDLVSLDVGGAYKLMHGGFTVNPVKAAEKADLNDGVVMGYANAMVGVPGLGLFGFADVLAGLNESQVYDYQLGLGWQFEGTLFDTRVRTGYRELNFNVDDFSGVTADTKFSGWFAGVELDF